MMLLIALLVPFAAAGSSAREAEAIRLESEIERLSQKRVWAGVERTYLRLLELKEVPITSNTHLSAAHAAQEQGDIRSAWDRAQRAAGVAGDAAALERASSWMADFYANYGEVAIEVAVSWKDPLELRSRDATFSPTARLVLDHAQAQLDTHRAFTGFLPMGRYSVSGTDFDVVGGPVERVFVKPGRLGVPTPMPSVEPDLVVPELVVPDRIVVLAARGGGWPADAWAPLSASVRDSLYQVEGVMAVDAFAPDDPWLVIRFDPEKLAATRPPLTVEQIAETLALTLELPSPVVSDAQIALLPGAATPERLASAVVGPGLKDTSYTLDALASIELGDPGPVPVPADTSEIARWRIELRVSGGVDGVLERLVPAASSPPGAEQLGFTLEGPATR